MIPVGIINPIRRISHHRIHLPQRRKNLQTIPAIKLSVADFYFFTHIAQSVAPTGFAHPKNDQPRHSSRMKWEARIICTIISEELGGFDVTCPPLWC